MRKTMIALCPAPESLAETRPQRVLSGLRPRSWVAAATALVALVCAPAAFGFHPPSVCELRPVPGSPFATANQMTSVAFSPSGGLLATANYPSDSASVFSVGRDGALSEVPGSPFATGFGTGFGTFSVAFSPSGRLLAAGSAQTGSVIPTTVSVFSVARNGTLTPVPGSPFAAGDRPSFVAFNPSGRLLAAANINSDSMSMFSVGRGGALSEVPGSPFPAGDAPYRLAFSPSGRLLAAANVNSDSVSLFSVARDGALTEVAGSPFPVGDAPQAVAFSPSGRLLATQSFRADTVSVFSVDWDGALSEVAGSPFLVGDGPIHLAFGPSDRLLAVANGLANSVSLFSVGRSGALSEISGSPLPVGASPFALAFNPSGRLLATADRAGQSVSVFAAERCRRKPAELVRAVPAAAEGGFKDSTKGTVFWDPPMVKEYAVKETK